MVHVNAYTIFSFTVALQLLGVDGCVLKEALTHKKITAKGEEVWCLLVTADTTVLLNKSNRIPVQARLLKYLWICITTLDIFLCVCLSADESAESRAGLLSTRRFI